MAKEYSRKETTHIDEVKRSAVCSMQWLVEPRNTKGAATHPITHNNQLKLFICGQDGFGDIADEIERAEKSIDLCCWGFDPGMELRRTSTTWPRGITFGDLLINAVRRGVKVRILVWKDWLGGKLVHNMPGLTHDTNGWGHIFWGDALQHLSATNSIRTLEDYNRKVKSSYVERIKGVFHPVICFPLKDELVLKFARKEYCASWFSAVTGNRIPGMMLLTRSGDVESIKRSLTDEMVKPAGFSQFEIEEAGLLHMGTHHQKTILIDYNHDGGRKAIGYVMGLNSVTDYWDTSEHKLDNPFREVGGSVEREESVQIDPPDSGFLTLKPYQDYACRIEAGLALVDVQRNFLGAWIRAGGGKGENLAEMRLEWLAAISPKALRRHALPGDSTVQVVRTQPEENDKSIRDAYWQATATAATTAGYIYIENQYFQCEHWAQHLLECRRQTMSKWRKASSTSGRTREDMPVLYLFIVMPVPERTQMIPRTHDTLATFGEHSGMEGQNKKIEEMNNVQVIPLPKRGGGTSNAITSQRDVVTHANSIDKPNKLVLETVYGLKVIPLHTTQSCNAPISRSVLIV